MSVKGKMIWVERDGSTWVETIGDGGARRSSYAGLHPLCDVEVLCAERDLPLSIIRAEIPRQRAPIIPAGQAAQTRINQDPTNKGS